MRAQLFAILFTLLATTALAKDVTIEVEHGSLKPAKVEIEKGDTVIFKNKVEMTGGHSVVAEDGSFASPALEKDGTWSKTFEKAGTFKIQLKEHPETRGEIVVE